MHIFKELKVWEKAVELVLEIYKIVSKFPKDETFGLTSQIKRAAVSIPSNIAEGAGRNSDNDFVRFLSIAQGSSYELHTQIVLANKLNLLSESDTNFLLDKIIEIQKMNYSLQLKIINKTKSI
jgi:four helix bundle protein